MKKSLAIAALTFSALAQADLSNSLTEIKLDYNLNPKTKTCIDDSGKKGYNMFARSRMFEQGIRDRIIHLNNMSCADFSNQGLEGADLYATYLDGANFSGANLTRSKLRGVFAKSANFLGAGLQAANFRGGEFRGTEFRGADLSGAHFYQTWFLDYTNLSKIDFFRAHFDYVKFELSYLTEADFSRASNITNTAFLSSNMNRAKFSGNSTFFRVVMRSSKLIGAAFDSTTLLRVDFLRSDLSNANFQAAELNDVDFDSAILKGTQFQASDLREVDFGSADIEGADFRNATLDKVNFKKVKNIEKANFQGTNYSYKNTVFPKNFNPKAHGMVKVFN